MFSQIKETNGIVEHRFKRLENLLKREVQHRRANETEERRRQRLDE